MATVQFEGPFAGLFARSLVCWRAGVLCCRSSLAVLQTLWMVAAWPTARWRSQAAEARWGGERAAVHSRARVRMV